MINTQEKINELRREIDDLRQQMTVQPFDYDAPDAEKRLTARIDEVFGARMKLLHERGRNAPDCSPSVLAYRQEGVRRLCREYDESFRQSNPLISVTDEFIKLCAPADGPGFNELEKRFHMETAAAIYILDLLRNSGKLDEALPYLPATREELDQADVPDITDTVHTYDLIRGMAHVIRFRNSGTDGFDKTKAWLSDADTRTHMPCTERERFEKVISLLDEAGIERAISRFKDCVREVVKEILTALSRYRERINAHIGVKIELLEKEIADLEAGLSAEFETTFTAAVSMRAEEDTATRRIESEINEMNAFLLSIPAYSKAVCRDETEMLGKEKLIRFFIPEHGDPFGMCFAFLMLLDRKDDVLCLYNAPLLVLSDACTTLPWARALIGDEEAQPAVTPDFYTNAVSLASEYLIPAPDSVLNRRIVTSPFAVSREPITFSQLTCLLSGLVPPRGSLNPAHFGKLLCDGMLTERESGILCEYLTLACALAERDENFVFVDEEESAEQESADDLSRLKRENKSLKALVNRLEHRLRDREEALRAAEERLDQTAAELSELKTMIRKTEKSDEEYTATVDFPYTARRRAVVFGGHLSWLKAIRPLLPNVRFIEPSAQPNTSLIMNAEVVWIQTNALSHSDFYKIIDVVRKHKIELRYFEYSGAEKCAEQFALDDMKEE